MEVGIDELEQILIRLDVKDIIECKSVCKSWYYLISSTSFVKSHLNRSYNNDQNNYKLRDRRIARPTIIHVDDDYYMYGFHIIGSCNGLVCLSPKQTQLIVINPLTRELKQLTNFNFRKRWYRHLFCWGFGYDSSLIDYKAVLGFTINQQLTRFYVLTLKSNSWKYVGQVKYQNTRSKAAVLYDGALYWFMSNEMETVIICLDLCRDELKEVPQPDHSVYLHECSKDHKLVIIGGCLCIHYDPWTLGPYRYHSDSYKTWVMDKNKSWQVLKCDDDFEMMKYDVVYCLRVPGDVIKNDNGHHGIYLSKSFEYVRAPVFVQSLVSPHVNTNINERPIKTKNNARLRLEKINKTRAKKDFTYFVMSSSLPLLLNRTRKRQSKMWNAKVCFN